MKNEKGMTLVELLGVLVIMSIVLTLAGAILTSSMKTSKRATTDQRLQQEANYITESIRNAFLQKGNEHIVLTIDGETLTMVKRDPRDDTEKDEIELSTGYQYECSGINCKENEETTHIVIEKNAKEKEQRQLILTLSANNQTHQINTIFSKLK